MGLRVPIDLEPRWNGSIKVLKKKRKKTSDKEMTVAHSKSISGPHERLLEAQRNTLTVADNSKNWVRHRFMSRETKPSVRALGKIRVNNRANYLNLTLKLTLM